MQYRAEMPTTKTQWKERECYKREQVTERKVTVINLVACYACMSAHMGLQELFPFFHAHATSVHLHRLNSQARRTGLWNFTNLKPIEQCRAWVVVLFHFQQRHVIFLLKIR
jgi:hypothetical protein